VDASPVVAWLPIVFAELTIDFLPPAAPSLPPSPLLPAADGGVKRRAPMAEGSNRTVRSLGDGRRTSPCTDKRRKTRPSSELWLSIVALRVSFVRSPLTSCCLGREYILAAATLLLGAALETRCGGTGCLG